jgi:hypothetical protein
MANHSLKLDDGIQIIVSTATRSGAPICPEAIARSLISLDCNDGLSAEQLSAKIVRAARKAGVSIRRERDVARHRTRLAGRLTSPAPGSR